MRHPSRGMPWALGGLAACAWLTGSCGAKTEELPIIVDTSVRNVASVTVGWSRTCALHLDGTADCWGNAGGLGVINAPSGPSPRRLPFQGLTQVQLDWGAPGGGAGGCVLDASGTVSCWGPDSVPTAITLPAPASMIDGRLSLLSDGRVFDYGTECKTGLALAAPPREVAWAKGAISVSSACAILADQTLFCASGCDTSPDLRAGPELKLRSIQGAGCALSDTGRVYCFGENYQMQCGLFHAKFDTATSYVAEPKEVLGIPNARALFYGYSTNCIAAVDGTVWCWGRFNLPMDFGRALECDDSKAVVGCTTPIEVPRLRGAKYIATDLNYGCAVMADDHVMCWGTNYDGELGQ